MVDFLLDNTLGAWHAGKVLAANPKLAEENLDEATAAVAVTIHSAARSSGVCHVSLQSSGSVTLLLDARQESWVDKAFAPGGKS